MPQPRKGLDKALEIDLMHDSECLHSVARPSPPVPIHIAQGHCEQAPELSAVRSDIVCLVPIGQPSHLASIDAV